MSDLEKQIADLKARLERKELEMQSIQQIGMTLSSVLNRDKLLILIMDEVTRLMHAERSTLFIVDNEKGELWSKIAQKAEIKEIHLKIGVGIAGHVAATGEVINIPDAYNDDRFDPTTDKKTGYRTRSILCMPIREPRKSDEEKGEIIGVLQVLNKVDGAFGKEDEELLKSLASQISISLVNSHLYTRLEGKLNELDLLFNIESKINTAAEVDELLSELIKLITTSMKSTAGLLLLNENDDAFFSKMYSHALNAENLPGSGVTAEDSILAKVTSDSPVYVCNDTSQDKNYKRSFISELGIETGHFICTALKTGSGIIGYLILMDKTEHHGYFSQSDEKMVESIASQIARGIQNMRLLEEKMKADRLATIGNMMSTIVHDLRTPMNNIYGFVDLMSEEESEETRQEYAGIINEQIKILTNMTTDVLDFAKGKTTILPAKYPVNKLVDEFTRFFKDDVERKGYKFESEVNTASMIYVDRDKVSRVFMNIMKNALEAMEPGGTFKLAAEEENGEIVFSLADTGSGIPPEIQDKLFDSFVTSGKEGGTGLGLAIVKKVVEEHKGRIEVHSKPGKGTTFKIYFPKL